MDSFDKAIDTDFSLYRADFFRFFFALINLRFAI